MGGAGQLTAFQYVYVHVAFELGEQGRAGLEGHLTVPRERARKSSLLNPLSRPADTGMPPLGYAIIHTFSTGLLPSRVLSAVYVWPLNSDI